MKLLPFSGWRAAGGALLLAATFAAAACSRFEYVSMRPLEDAGFRYSAVKQIQDLDPTKGEVEELVKASRGGVSETTCVQLIQAARAQKTHFAEGDAVAALHAAGISDETIVELAQLRQIASWSGEAEAIRLTGTSDRVILVVARRRAAGLPVPSGASLAQMKDAGVNQTAILELIDRGITDSDVASVVWRKNRGWKDEQILRDFPEKH